MIAHARNLESIRPLTNNERRAQWAARYYLAGLHHDLAAGESPREPPVHAPQQRATTYEEYVAAECASPYTGPTIDMG